jgi:CubicO group peptidase (beta-lactamase class C family)
MRHGKSQIAILLLTSVISLVFVGCGGETISARGPDPAAQVEALFEPWTVGDSPGAAVMVIENGEILFEGGFGLANLESRTPITPQSAFRLASVSKQFTAMAVMILAERGQLAYDDELVEHLPELASYGDDITLRHLLAHLGGLRAMEFLAGWGEPLFEAGDRYEYSNPGYEMLALVVERVSGQTFRVFLEENIFEPLGMHSAVVRDSSEPEIANRVYGYSRKEDTFVLSDDHVLNHIIGSGGVYASVRDLALWDEALYTETLVRRSTLEEAWSPVRLNDGEEYPYGFGWRLGPNGALGRRVAHAGRMGGFQHIHYPLSGAPIQRHRAVQPRRVREWRVRESNCRYLLSVDSDHRCDGGRRIRATPVHGRRAARGRSDRGGRRPEGEG